MRGVRCARAAAATHAAAVAPHSDRDARVRAERFPARCSRREIFASAFLIVRGFFPRTRRIAPRTPRRGSCRSTFSPRAVAARRRRFRPRRGTTTRTASSRRRRSGRRRDGEASRSRRNASRKRSRCPKRVLSRCGHPSPLSIYPRWSRTRRRSCARRGWAPSGGLTAEALRGAPRRTARPRRPAR